jgi:hypothetical protein
MTILVRSETNRLGYEPYSAPKPLPDSGPWLPADFVPWGVLVNSVVVFARRHSPPPRGEIKPYTKQTNKLRRGLCEEALASVVSQRRVLVECALLKVNAGIEKYVRAHIRQSKRGKRVRKMAQSFRHALYSDKHWDGRLGPKSAAPAHSLPVVESALAALKTATVPQVMNIHSTIIFGIYKEVGGITPEQDQLHDEWMSKLRPQDLFAIRGRKAAVYEGPATQDGQGPGPLPSTRGGILGPYDPRGGREVEERIRGVDEWEEDADNPSPFGEDVQANNLIFVAGPSGTTIALLTAARMFGDLDEGELLKQYVLGCVAFLVEGGHHSYHEVMVIAALAGCPYAHGQFLPSLPQSFLMSREFLTWKTQYYDIVMNLPCWW